MKIGMMNGDKQIKTFLKIAISILTVCLLTSIISCKEPEGSINDEYGMLVSAFTRFVVDASDFQISHIEKYIADDKTEFYYFEMNITNSTDSFDTSGVIQFTSNGIYRFVHSSDMNRNSNHDVISVFNDLKASGKGKVLNMDEIQNVTARIKELQKAQLPESTVNS